MGIIPRPPTITGIKGANKSTTIERRVGSRGGWNREKPGTGAMVSRAKAEGKSEFSNKKQNAPDSI
jgi:hypothetical protein